MKVSLNAIMAKLCTITTNKLWISHHICNNLTVNALVLKKKKKKANLLETDITLRPKFYTLSRPSTVSKQNM